MNCKKYLNLQSNCQICMFHVKWLMNEVPVVFYTLACVKNVEETCMFQTSFQGYRKQEFKGYLRQM